MKIDMHYNGELVTLDKTMIDNESVAALGENNLRWYAERRALFHPSDCVFMEFFGVHHQLVAYRELIDAFETNPVYLAVFDKARAERDAKALSELWNPRIAVEELNRLIKNPSIERIVRINAAKERDSIFANYPGEATQ